MRMRRVVVTGMGTVNPLGNSLLVSWDAAKSACSGIRALTGIDAEYLEWKVAGELKQFHPQDFLTLKEIHRIDLFVQFAVAAALMAAEDASVDRKKLEKGGVFIGSSRGGISTIEKALKNLYSRPVRKRTRLSAYLMPATTISMAATQVSQKLGIKGHCLGISNACASGTNAIGEAYRYIKHGYADLILCGGAEAPISEVCIAGYGSSGALSRINSQDASRPFDLTRDGFVLAEGASILMLESYGEAIKRNAKIYGEVLGYGNSADACHQTVPAREGEIRAIHAAIAEAKLRPQDISLIYAHGTSTPIGDRIETEAIKAVFQDQAYAVPVSAIKSMTGHMLAASGALEAAFALMSLKEGVILPTINLREHDPECDIRYVTELKNADLQHVLSHSFGFGGINAVLVFRKWDA